MQNARNDWLNIFAVGGSLKKIKSLAFLIVVSVLVGACETPTSVDELAQEIPISPITARLEFRDSTFDLLEVVKINLSDRYQEIYTIEVEDGFGFVNYNTCKGCDWNSISTQEAVETINGLHGTSLVAADIFILPSSLGRLYAATTEFNDFFCQFFLIVREGSDYGADGTFCTFLPLSEADRARHKLQASLYIQGISLQ